MIPLLVSMGEHCLLFLIQAGSSCLWQPGGPSLGGHDSDVKLHGAPDLHAALCPEHLAQVPLGLLVEVEKGNKRQTEPWAQNKGLQQ